MKAERATAAGCTIAGGSDNDRRAFVLAAACTVASVAVPAAARAQAGKPFSIDALMVLLAQRGSGQARFTEERTVAGFEGPLRSSGLLSFTAPDRFSRETLEPRRERMEVAGNQIRLERGGRVRVLTLDAVPELVALVEGLRGTLSGNAALLRKHFELRLEGQARLWTLTLLPLDSTLASQVRQLQISGTQGDLRSVDMQMAGQQRSLMTIEPLSPAAAGTGAGASTAAAPAAVSGTAAAAAASGTAPR
ncbi:MAG: LolA-related protein [Rubrivivax sp.]